MLLGEHKQAVNSRGQLVLPEQVLTELEGDLVVTRGFERNLLLFREQDWRELAGKLLAEPISSYEVRTLRRRFFSAAEIVSPDANGRVILPATLRDFAGINGQIILAGMYDYIELWSIEQWLPVKETVEDNSDGRRWDSIGV